MRYPNTPAQRRITERHGNPVEESDYDAPMPPAEAIDAVLLSELARAGENDDARDHHRPDDQDVEDALRLLGLAREVLEYQEMQLIDMARSRGWTWDRIGVALGIGDRRKAQQRYRRLRERTPDYTPLHVEREGAR
jgi:hypothetical protein